MGNSVCTKENDRSGEVIKDCNGRALITEESLQRMPKAKPLFGAVPTPEIAGQSESTEYTVGNHTIKYFGKFLNGKRQGQGQIFVEPTNDMWLCHFEQDQAQGPGKIYFGNGDFFEGTLEANQLKEGKYQYASGEVYEGEFKEGKPHGKGSYQLKNGTCMRATFIEGTMQVDEPDNVEGTTPVDQRFFSF